MKSKKTKTDLMRKLNRVLKKHIGLHINPTRQFMIKESIKRKEAIVSQCGALVTWTPFESTGRSPKDTYIVEDSITRKTVDWNSKNNIKMKPEVFNMIWDDAVKTLSKADRIYLTDRSLGADVNYALNVRTVTNHALTALFTDNMFRPVQKNISKSAMGTDIFTMLVLPYDKLDPEKYKGKLRFVDEKGYEYKGTSRMAVAMDMNRRLGVVYASAYGGSVKKLMFTVMNYLSPEAGILPLHCSANEGRKGDCALLLGLSGTGKTTLSADPSRALLGDDEHGWSDDGIYNFENGCYAKLIDLKEDKEPDIWHAVLHDDNPLKHGVIIENAMMYPNGTFDLDDKRITENSRASYPLSYLTNIKQSSISGHPSTILFLTADATGVLPPIAKLTTEQAMLWFLIGYTSKLAGTETGVKEPEPTFSRFFGQPFMPRNPDVYAKMLGEKLEKHKTRVYLINTGWSGGDFHEGKRIEIKLTRRMVHAALDGELENVKYKFSRRFHLRIPTRCPGVPSKMLNPINTWKSKRKYIKKARKLAQLFAETFDKNYSGKGIDNKIESQCPGK